MRAHYLQHVSFEGLGSIESWLKCKGYEITCTRLFDGQALPDIRDIDFLIIMGGPMSVHDEAEYPWLLEEKAFVRSAIEAGKKVLGICLGAQLIACVRGARVFPNAVKEIGWFPIKGVLTDDHYAFKFPEQAEAFHWHGETFDLPQGAVHLAQSEACKHQAFQIGSHVMGLQFHLETTPDSARALIEHCGNELVVGKFIQAEIELLSADEARYVAINDLMAGVLEYLHETDAS